MPDDERLGGTRDPHEYGRRHRREEPPVSGGAEEKPRRRRRSLEAGGGVSVADLVQKHGASRADLTPIDPRQLQQNGVMSGRRARQDRPSAEGPAGRGHPGEAPRRQAPPPPPVPDALGGPDFPRDDAPRPTRFPQDDNPRRPHPGEAARNGRRAAEAPGEAGPRRATGAFLPGPAAPVGETSGHHALPDAPAPRARRAGESSAHHAVPADAPSPSPRPRRARRAGEASAHHAVPAEAPYAEPRNGHHAIPGDAFPVDEAAGPHAVPSAPRNGRHSGRPSAPADTRNGFAPGEGSGHHAIPGEPRNGRPGETSARFPALGDAVPVDDARNGYPPGRGTGSHAIPGEPRKSRPGNDARNGFAPGEGSGHHAIPGEPRNGRPGKPDAFPIDDARNGFTPSDGTGPHGIPGEPRNGRRPGKPDAFPVDDARNGYAPNEGTGPHGIPGEPHNGRRPGEASGRFPAAGEGIGALAVPGAPRNGRRAGQSSAQLPTPDDAFPIIDVPDGYGPADPPALTGRRPGEGSVRVPVPGEPPAFPNGRRGAEPPAFPRDDAPRNGRRPGEASAHHPVPGRFPVDEARRQGPPTPPPGQWPADPLSEPRLTPAAIDAPDARPKTTGVPPVPPPVPPRGDDDLVSMTTEMEAIGEEVQKRRTIDHTLARFSAVHDEIKAEEREKKAKRRKLLPWQNVDDEMDRLDELEAQQSMAMRIPVIPPEDDEPEEEDRKGRKKKRKKLRGRNAGKAFVVIVAGMVFASTAAAWGFKSYFEAAANTVDALDPDSKAIQDAAAQVGDENFLLVGSDTRAGATADDGVGDENEVQGARSDTVMIAHIPENRERVVVVSFPRDLEVTRPACEGWNPKTGEPNGVQHPAEERVKLNTAYQIGGPKCVTKMVQELSGLAINHFVGIDFHGFKDMVDAVQGVDVCVERPMKDDVLGVIVPQAGKQVRLTGDQALNFVRARHVQGDVTSDYGRITRQQRFLSSLLRKAMSSEVLLDPGKLTGFVNAFSKATFGDNIGVDQLFTLGQSMQGMQAGRVTFITVPTVGEANERGNEELRVEDNQALFDAIRQDAPLPGEAPVKKTADDASKKPTQSTLAQDQPQGPVDPKTIKIQVLNGGNPTGGIAGATADALSEYGFQVMRVDSAPENVDKPAVIRYSKARAAEAQTLQAAVPGAVLVEDPAMVGAIMLIVGPGFDGEVVSPNGGGKTVEVPEGLATVNAGDVSCA